MNNIESTNSENEEKYPTNKKSFAESQIVRKLDFFYVVPFVFLTSFLQFIDKATLSSAAVLGIREDTHITNDQFGFTGSILFLGFLFAQIFSIIFIQKFSPKRYLTFLIIAWGSVITLTALAKTFLELPALRFILGLLEGGVYPCCVMIINRMYRRSEQARRIFFLVIGNGAASACGGFISYGIGHMVNVGGLHPWQWLMIILGSITVLFGIFCLLFMVDNPKGKILLLSPEQEKIVDDRILDNGGYISKKIKFVHIKEALKEPRYYCYIVAGVLTNFQNGALFTFGTILISNLGFSNLNTILISAPTGIMTVIFSTISSWYIGRYGNLHYATCVCFSSSSLAILLIIVIPIYKAKLIGIYLSLSFAPGYMIILSSIVNNVTGSTKKLFYISSTNAAFTLGNYIGPLLMVDKQKPIYIGAFVTFIASNIVGITLLLIARHIMSKSNKNRLENLQSINPEEKQEEDLTDRENPNFIYKL